MPKHVRLLCWHASDLFIDVEWKLLPSVKVEGGVITRLQIEKALFYERFRQRVVKTKLDTLDFDDFLLMAFHGWKDAMRDGGRLVWRKDVQFVLV